MQTFGYHGKKRLKYVIKVNITPAYVLIFTLSLCLDIKSGQDLQLYDHLGDPLSSVKCFISDK